MLNHSGREEIKMEEKYVYVGKPDLKRLGELITRAKGPNRTMAQFAEECGIGASTMSRIANGKITKPVSMDNLKAIYEHRDKSFTNPFVELVACNGMMPESEYNEVSKKTDYTVRRYALQRQELQMQNILVSELGNRGISVTIKPRNSRAYKQVSFMRIFPDKSFILGGEGMSGDEQRFDSELSLYMYPVWEDDTDQKFYAERRVHMILQRASVIFLADSWEPDVFNDTRTSFVFADPNVYKLFVEKVNGAPIKSAMSAILLDLSENKIAEETEFSSSCGRHSPFDEPVIKLEQLSFPWMDYESAEDADSSDEN